MRLFLFVFLSVFSFSAVAQVAPEPASGRQKQSVVRAKEYMVVAANPHAVKAGEVMLAKGGNAIDAAIAVQMVLNVVEPQSSGIGGGGFLLYYDQLTKKVGAYDGRETAPSEIKTDIFLDKDGKPLPFFDAVQGGRSVGTPGLLAMLKEVHDKHGKLAWAELFTPAIILAENGFALSPRLHKVLSYVDYLPRFKQAAALFLDDAGNIKPIGTIITNKALAETFRTLAREGIKPFYEGNIAQAIVDAVQKTSVNPSVLSMKDLKAYRSKYYFALCGEFYDHKICGMPPSSSGGVAILQALGILAHKENVFSNPPTVRMLHLMTETMRVIFADRNAFIADPAYVKMPIREMLANIYLEKRAAMIEEDEVADSVEEGDFLMNYCAYDNGYDISSTTHMSIVDAEGNAVSMTSSIEHAFGSLLMAEGFFLNNQLTDFAFVPEKDGKVVANAVAPKKRPRSSMSPMIVLDKDFGFKMAVGSPGGSRIIPYVLQVMVAVLEGKVPVQDAVNLPHFVSMNRGVTELEKGYFSTDVIQGLRDKGHIVKEMELNSGIHAIVKENGVYIAGVDPRREGMARGK